MLPTEFIISISFILARPELPVDPKSCFVCMKLQQSEFRTIYSILKKFVIFFIPYLALYISSCYKFYISQNPETLHCTQSNAISFIFHLLQICKNFMYIAIGICKKRCSLIPGHILRLMNGCCACRNQFFK